MKKNTQEQPSQNREGSIKARTFRLMIQDRLKEIQKNEHLDAILSLVILLLNREKEKE